MNKKIETQCPYCFTWHPKSVIIEHMAFTHGEVMTYEEMKRRFSAIGGFAEQETK